MTTFLDMIAWACPSGRDASAAVASVGEPYVTYLARDQVLPWAETQAFMNATGLTVEAPASYPIDW